MSGRTAYLDSSAFVKLLITEPESAALKEAAENWTAWASATLLRTEVARTLRRTGNDGLLGETRRMMAALYLIRLDEPLLDWAGELRPVRMRTLDAVHLAAALSIGSDLGVFYTYDARLGEAALAQGLPVAAPA